MLVEDSDAVRAMLRVTVRVNRLGRIVAEALTSADASRLAAREQPDVIVLDLGLPDASAPDVFDIVRTASPDSRLVIFSAHESKEAWCVQQGAIFVAKSNGPAGLVTALNAP